MSSYKQQTVYKSEVVPGREAMPEYNWDTFAPYMEEGFLSVLLNFMTSEKMHNIFNAVASRKKYYEVYPEFPDTFGAFKHCKWQDLKVVIIADQPYKHPKWNDGLAYSKKMDCDLESTPELDNILNRVEQDVYDGFNPDTYLNYSLTRWAEQGVLLLNTALTTQKENPTSHHLIWRPFITEVIENINAYNNGTVFMLWGLQAKTFKSYIDDSSHYVLECSAPTKEGWERGFKHCDHFSKANEYLKENNGEDQIINW